MKNIIYSCMKDSSHTFIAANDRYGLTCPICRYHIKAIGDVINGTRLPTYEELRIRISQHKDDC